MLRTCRFWWRHGVIYDFDKNIKSVDIILKSFHNSGEPTLEPMSDWEKHSADKGHWHVGSTCLSIKDIEFLYKRVKNYSA